MYQVSHLRGKAYASLSEFVRHFEGSIDYCEDPQVTEEFKTSMKKILKERTKEILDLAEKIYSEPRFVIKKKNKNLITTQLSIGIKDGRSINFEFFFIESLSKEEDEAFKETFRRLFLAELDMVAWLTNFMDEWKPLVNHVGCRPTFKSEFFRKY